MAAQLPAEAYPVSELGKPTRRHASPGRSHRDTLMPKQTKPNNTVPSSSVFPLTRIDKTPNWLVYNESVLTGYRRWNVSAGAAVRSLFQVHNESGNIWTHLLGLLGFASLGWHTLAHALPDAQALEKLGVGVFFFGVITCMFFSVVYHTFNSVSRPWHDVLLRLDYFGITVQIFTSFVPTCIYSHYCDVALQRLYLLVLGGAVLASLLLIQLCLFGHASRRPARTAVYTAVGALGGLPVLHYVALARGTAAWWPAVNLLLGAGSMGALFAVGGVVYVVRVPERWAPGKFDIWLNSHQLFHLLTVIAASMHYKIIMHVYEQWHDPLRPDAFRCAAAAALPAAANPLVS